MGLIHNLLYAWHQGGTAPLVRAFEAALADPERAQRRTLGRILRRSRGTEYGLGHGFRTITGPDQYRGRVPLVEYEDLARVRVRNNADPAARGLVDPEPAGNRRAPGLA